MACGRMRCAQLQEDRFYRQKRRGTPYRETYVETDIHRDRDTDVHIGLIEHHRVPPYPSAGITLYDKVAK